jgi:hypothetical protein
MHARPTAAKPTVVIAPRSPLEMEGDSDYEGMRKRMDAYTDYIII